MTEDERGGCHHQLYEFEQVQIVKDMGTSLAAGVAKNWLSD